MWCHLCLVSEYLLESLVPLLQLSLYSSLYHLIAKAFVRSAICKHFSQSELSLSFP